jgi:hypothetical protein
MDITEKMEIMLGEAFDVEEFDDVKSKASKKLFKVVEILMKGGARVFKLRPLEGKATASDEFDVENKKFFKEYVAA